MKLSMSLPPVICIVGIDTDVGKTIVTGVYARELAHQGFQVITQKLVQTGCDGVATDIRQHRYLQGLPLLDEDTSGLTCRYVFTYPCSPHMAAAIEQREIDVCLIERDTINLSTRFDVVLLEAAGGLAVPLTPELTILDYIQQRSYPVVLVSSGKLGSINHTLLSLMGCQQAGIPVLRLVYNRYPQYDPRIAENTENYLRDYIQRHHPQTEFVVFDKIEI